MKEYKVGITLNFKQYYLPTKRHRNERSRDMVTCRDITFKQAESEEDGDRHDYGYQGMEKLLQTEERQPCASPDEGSKRHDP